MADTLSFNAKIGVSNPQLTATAGRKQLDKVEQVAQTGLGPGRLGLPARIPHGPRPGSLSGICQYLSKGIM